LISILLPALSKARDQANAVTCQSTLRQFHTLWTMYANQNKGHVVPARYQLHSGSVSAEFGFYEATFLGTVLKNSSGAYSNTLRAADTAHIIKQLLQCKAANHSGDPDPDTAAKLNTPNAYYGDYIYNSYMGVRKTDASDVEIAGGHINPTITQVPANVIIMMESYKPNLIIDGSGNWKANDTLPGNNYKYYFEKASEIWTTGLASGPSSNLVPLRIGTPHSRNKKMNVLCADGHISLVDPYRDFFENPNDQKSCKEYLWNAKDDNHSGWKKGASGI
jgi:hypothetical protein